MDSITFIVTNADRVKIQTFYVGHPARANEDLVDGYLAMLLIAYAWLALLNPWNCASMPFWS